MKNKDILRFFSILLIVLVLSSCSYARFKYDFFTGYLVRDYNFEWYGRKSEKINANNRYCLYYNGRSNALEVKGYDMNKFNQQLIEILNSKDLKIKDEVFNFEKTKAEKDEIEKNIKQREKNNNFQNCNYLLVYDIRTNKRFKEGCINFNAIKISDNRSVSRYYICGKNISYTLIEQKEFLNNAVNKLFEYQLKPNKEKVEMIKCQGNICEKKTCVGEKCKIDFI